MTLHAAVVNFVAPPNCTCILTFFFNRASSQVEGTTETALLPTPAAVAEEGIDVRSCQLVVRYDLPDTAQVGRTLWNCCLLCWT